MRSAAMVGAIAMLSVLTAAGCTGDRPMSPSAGSFSRIRPLRTAIVLEPVVSQFRIAPPPGKVGRFRCRSGFAFLRGPGANPARCYRQIGRPVTITSAAIAAVEDLSPKWGLVITLPRRERAALAAVSRREVGHLLAVVVAGKVWEIPYVQTPLPDGMFEIGGLTRTQANLLQRTLVQTG